MRPMVMLLLFSVTDHSLGVATSILMGDVTDQHHAAAPSTASSHHSCPDIAHNPEVVTITSSATAPSPVTCTISSSSHTTTTKLQMIEHLHTSTVPAPVLRRVASIMWTMVINHKHGVVGSHLSGRTERACPSR